MYRLLHFSVISVVHTLSYQLFYTPAYLPHTGAHTHTHTCICIYGIVFQNVVFLSLCLLCRTFWEMYSNFSVSITTSATRPNIKNTPVLGLNRRPIHLLHSILFVLTYCDDYYYFIFVKKLLLRYKGHAVGQLVEALYVTNRKIAGSIPH
jgi:hypothetical protein